MRCDSAKRVTKNEVKDIERNPPHYGALIVSCGVRVNGDFEYAGVPCVFYCRVHQSGRNIEIRSIVPILFTQRKDG